MIQALMENIVWVLGFLLAVSEVLAFIPFIRSNSIIQLFIQIMQAIKGIIRPQSPEPQNQEDQNA